MYKFFPPLRPLSLLLLILVTACGSVIDPFNSPPSLPDAVTHKNESSPLPTLPPIKSTLDANLSSATFSTHLPAATAGPDCDGGVANPIASSFAAEYPPTSEEEVMVWFCNGAEFEDIFTALFTRDTTGVSVEELLEMLADGFTWDEIWLVTGLTG